MKSMFGAPVENVFRRLGPFMGEDGASLIERSTEMLAQAF
jgi:hypothetical protein